jgi:hypothetical protein
MKAMKEKKATAMKAKKAKKATAMKVMKAKKAAGYIYDDGEDCNCQQPEPPAATRATTMKIRVETIIGNTFTLDVEANDTIDNVLSKIQGICGTSELILELERSHTLSSYNIQDGDTLLMSSCTGRVHGPLADYEERTYARTFAHDLGRLATRTLSQPLAA